MKNLAIIETLSHGARFTQLPANFKVNVNISNDVVFLEFVDEHTNENVFGTFFFVDDDSYRSFDDFSDVGQELILARLSEAIAADIACYISGNYNKDEDFEVCYHEINGCLDIESYKGNWEAYYDLITDDEDILDEYTEPEEKGDEEQ